MVRSFGFVDRGEVVGVGEMRDMFGDEGLDDSGEWMGSSFMYSALLSLFLVVHVKWRTWKISENMMGR